MIILATTSEEIKEVKAALKSACKMKELGEAKFILEMEIDHDHSATTLMIKHTRYIDDVVTRFSQFVDPVTTPPLPRLASLHRHSNLWLLKVPKAPGSTWYHPRCFPICYLLEKKGRLKFLLCLVNQSVFLLHPPSHLTEPRCQQY
ncbi:hypothetical protein PHMEG_0009024 [Phytophthora megakarya]|uniref:Reverse transcriptase Ty1/copia-type domain-containing protein n=1 Tax=Phytophthora megakarya TaxID=4795 RepID=A0A225WJ85_9STRA|nr:hypothetical protein PHMEG_0009024 [Phytophthora megakarya]